MNMDERVMTSKLVSMANENVELMDGTTAPVKKLIEDHELVYGIWQDDTMPDGIGVHVIKGKRQIMEAMTSGDGAAVATSVTAIGCDCLEQAVAAQQAFGDVGLD